MTNRKSYTGFPTSHQPRFYAAPNFLKMGISYLNLLSFGQFQQYRTKVCCKVSLCKNCQRQSCSAINRLSSGINHAPLDQYYELTRVSLQPILDDLNNKLQCSVTLNTSDIDRSYSDVVAALKYSADLSIPQRAKNFYKFWWNDELAELKRLGIASTNIWKEAGKPKSGPIFSNYKKTNYITSRPFVKSAKGKRKYSLMICTMLS